MYSFGVTHVLKQTEVIMNEKEDVSSEVKYTVAVFHFLKKWWTWQDQLGQFGDTYLKPLDIH